MLGQPTAIPFSAEAMRASLLRLEEEWETAQASRDRDAIYQYLTAVFELVAWWAQEGRTVGRAHRALHLRGHGSFREPEPFATIVRCTSDPAKVDDRTRSKWSMVLRYAAEFKDLDEPLRDFIKRKGGINKCAARFARCLGRHRRYVRRWLGASRKHSRRPRTSVPVRTNLRRRQVIL